MVSWPTRRWDRYLTLVLTEIERAAREKSRREKLRASLKAYWTPERRAEQGAKVRAAFKQIKWDKTVRRARRKAGEHCEWPRWQHRQDYPPTGEFLAHRRKLAERAARLAKRRKAAPLLKHAHELFPATFKPR